MASFKKSLDRLKEICTELRQIDSAANRKLSAAAFAREAQAKASAPLAELKERWRQADQLPAAQSAMRTLCRWITADTGMTLTRTPPDTNRLVAMVRSDRAMTEFASVNLTAWDAWALAIDECAESKPDCFGPVDDTGAFDTRFAVLEAEFDGLCEALETSWTAKDIKIEDAGRGLIAAEFLCAPVALGSGAGRRLGQYMRHNE
jgi:hypothetical protein